MIRVIREGVATPYDECNICRRPTRSHVLEPAIYDEFRAEEVIDKSDDFASKQWEEVEEITKYRLAKTPVVLCHRCYVVQENKLAKMIDNNYDRWVENPVKYIARIRTIAETHKYYKFTGALEVRVKSLVKVVKELPK